MGQLDPVPAHLFQEVRVAQLAALHRAPIELLEDGEQHQGDHQPDSNFREPLIIQAKLQKGDGRAHRAYLGPILGVSSKAGVNFPLICPNP